MRDGWGLEGVVVEVKYTLVNLPSITLYSFY